MGSALLTSFSILFDPLVAGLPHERRISDLDAIFKTSTRWMFTLGLPLSLVEILFAPEIILGFVCFVILWRIGIEQVDREVIRSAFARLHGRRSSDTAPTAPGR